jgi:hypothetical protein
MSDASGPWSVPGDGNDPASTYSNLMALNGHWIERASKVIAESLDVDLVTGYPDRSALFLALSAPATKEALQVTRACNDVLRNLFLNRGKGFFQPDPSQAYARTAFCERAYMVLGVIFGHINDSLCGSAHEVLLSFSDTLDELQYTAASPNTGFSATRLLPWSRTT